MTNSKNNSESVKVKKFEDGKITDTNINFEKLPCLNCEWRWSIHCPKCKWNEDGKYCTY